MNILAVFAHPDDESFGPSGTLGRAAAEGHTVSLLTLTRGEAGSLGISKELAPEELARRRTKELECAAKVLGIKNLKIMKHPDKGLKDISDADGMALVMNTIEEFSPDLVTTFHPNGISGHPDHQTVSRWTLDAVRKMANPPILLYFGLAEVQARRITHRQLNAMADEKITHRIDVSDYIDLKIRAMHCHETQDELWKQFETLPGGFEDFFRCEYFSQAWPKAENTAVAEQLF